METNTKNLFDIIDRQSNQMLRLLDQEARLSEIYMALIDKQHKAILEQNKIIAKLTNELNNDDDDIA